jgi:hypothetical protein
MNPEPEFALSIRQPWAWLIVNGHKDVENRSWPTKFRGRFLVHASATMTRGDYEACVIFISQFRTAWRLPAFDVLKAQCGGIVGAATLMDCTRADPSPWFVGDYGFVLAKPEGRPFLRCKGRLGFFRVK